MGGVETKVAPEI